MPYPVDVSVEPALTDRNRLTTAFRVILAIPHLFLVGGIGIGYAYGGGRDKFSAFGGETGLLGAVAFLLAIVAWFTIVFGGTHGSGIRDFTRFYLRWRVRGLAYLMLLADVYPPFGDAPYPASITIVDPVGARDRLTVAFRLLLVVPHAIVLVFLMFAWWVTAIVAWVSILITRTYPETLYRFGVGCLRWLLRIEAYVLLLVDEYPPFSFS